MNYNSTRNAALQVTAAQAIAQGISEEGGLFVPQSFPKVELTDMLSLDYIGRAEYVLSRFLTDFTPEEIKACAESAYGGGKFDDNLPGAGRVPRQARRKQAYFRAVARPNLRV